MRITANGVKTPRSLSVILWYLILKKKQQQNIASVEKIKGNAFPGAKLDDIYDCIKPLFKNCLKAYYCILGQTTLLMKHQE